MDGDRIRDITGNIQVGYQAGIKVPIAGGGAIYSVRTTAQVVQPNTGPIAEDPYQGYFDASRVVPTGPDNAPRTLSEVKWRRVG